MEGMMDGLKEGGKGMGEWIDAWMGESVSGWILGRMGDVWMDGRNE